jgi:tRNA threonylcarbamoyladenosine biosynthesis protein TsaB
MSGTPDGPLLALDSSTATGSVAVGDASGILSEVVLRVGVGASSSLMPAVDHALALAGLRPADLRAVVVGGGPGSFTGLRVAAATAKGVVFALRVPLLSYSGLLAAAVAGSGARGEVCALFDARRRDVYAGWYRFREQGTGNREQEGRGKREEGRATAPGLHPAAVLPSPLVGEGPGEGGAVVETLLPPTALSLEELLETAWGAEPPLFVGEGAAIHRAEIERVTGARVGSPLLGLPRASALLWLAAHDPQAGRVKDTAVWEPDYVRASGAERIAGERAAGPGAGT